MRRCSLLLCLWIGCSFLQSPADATTRKQKTLRKQINQLYEQSQVFVRKAQYARAITRLKNAVRLMRHLLSSNKLSSSLRQQLQKGLFRLIFAQAFTYNKADQKFNAQRSLLSALKLTDIPSAYRQKAERFLQTFHGKLVIQSQPDGATFQLKHESGRQRLIKTPFEGKELSGQWTITLKEKEFKAIEEVLELPTGQDLMRSFRLEKKPTLSKLAIFTPMKGSQIKIRSVDGSECTGITPFHIRLKHGRWQIRVELPGHGTYEKMWMIKKRHSLQLQLTAGKATQHTQDLLAWTGLGLGVVAAGTGAVLTGLAQSAFAPAREQLGNPNLDQTIREGYESGRSLQYGGYIAFGVAGLSTLLSLGAIAMKRPSIISASSIPPSKHRPWPKEPKQCPPRKP